MRLSTPGSLWLVNWLPPASDPTLGRLVPGAVVDLVWWGGDLKPRRVWVDGEVVFDATVDTGIAVASELAAAGQ
ncbi:hypothetical protein [Saccharothrix variisporea]|uniref:hypothetical protein n=1 Tax=Saccharothrix variisporea TaxID=543527 RepID=UPI0011C4819D|nr:hypothetical protein [Saccharothrix variisporea]